jgi:hypothetical protein
MLGPNLLRELLHTIRAPRPIIQRHVDDALDALAEGSIEEESSPRINAVQFERWFDKAFGEEDEEA